jgi:polyhydroxybutyrate depolymerase
MAFTARMGRMLALFAAFVAAPLAEAQELAQPCPVDQGCKVASGIYRILLPREATTTRPYGAIVYFHGYQGTASEIVADPALVEVARRLGVALIAPEGIGRSWSFPGSPAQNRDELAFVAQMLDDAARRFPIDPGRLMASGFSQGGSMVWHLACRMPERFAAFAPIAGAFWEPLPQSCTGQRPKLIHVHGTNDGTVPLAGRQLRQGFRQGDVFKSFSALAPGGCTTDLPDMARSVSLGPALTCRQANACSGARLELCLHDGGHVADAAWVERAWRLTMPAEPASLAARPVLTSP